MMSMADGGGSAAGQQVLHDLMIIKWCDVAFGVNNHRGFDVGLISAENHLTGGPGCDILIMKLRVSLKCVKHPLDTRRTWL